MEIDTNLEYTSDALMTEYLFFSGLNAINIFVEDKNKEYEYETIFKRMLNDKYNINKIFGVGGKDKLKQSFFEYGEFDKNNETIKNVYIADGDFDRYIYGTKMIENAHFIYLKAYNIENYFIDKKACESYAKGLLQCMDEEVESIVDFNTWKEKIVSEASKLFFYYCYVQRESFPIENVSRSPYLFIDYKTGYERAGAFDSYKNAISALDGNSGNVAEEEIKKIKIKYYEINEDAFNLICGKFLLTSLYCHLKHVIRNNDFRKKDLRSWLIEGFDINKLNYVKLKILNIMRT